MLLLFWFWVWFWSCQLRGIGPLSWSGLERSSGDSDAPVFPLSSALVREPQLLGDLVNQQAVVGVEGRWEL